MTEELLTDQQIETLAAAWPWEHEQTAAALRLGEAEGWELDATVAALDVLAKDFPHDSDPEQVIRAAIEYKRAERRRQQDERRTRWGRG